MFDYLHKFHFSPKTIDINDIPSFDFPVLKVEGVKVEGEIEKRVSLRDGKSLKTIIKSVDEGCFSLKIDVDDTLMGTINANGSQMELRV